MTFIDNLFLGFWFLLIFALLYFICFLPAKTLYEKNLENLADGDVVPRHLYFFLRRDIMVSNMLFPLWPLYVAFIIGCILGRDIFNLLKVNDEHEISTWYIK